MKTIRENVFETNSSSMHAIVISRNEDYYWDKKVTKPIVFDLSKDFSTRALYERNSINDKASYLFHLICNFVEGLWPYHYDTAFTEGEIEKVDHIYSNFEKLLKKIKDYYKEEKNIEIDFINYGLDRNNSEGYAHLSSESYSTLGCYDHSDLIAEKDLNTFFRYMEEDLLEKRLIEKNSGFWFMFDEILEFATNKNSVILQGSDEMDDWEIKKQKKLVMKYMRKNKGDASVLWPLGG